MTGDAAPGTSPEDGPTGAPLRRPAAFEARFAAGFVGRLAADSMAFARSNARSSQLRRQVSTSPRGSISAPRPVRAPSAGTVGSPRWWHPTLRSGQGAAAETTTTLDGAAPRSSARETDPGRPVASQPVTPGATALSSAASRPAPPDSAAPDSAALVSAATVSAPPVAPASSAPVQRQALPPRRDLTAALPARGLPRVVQRVPDEKTWTPGSFSQTTAPKPIPMRLPAEVRAAGTMMTPQDRRRRPSPQETRPSASEPAPGKSSGASTQPTAERTGAAADSRARQATPQVPAPRTATTRSTPPPVRRFLRRRALAARIVNARTEQAQQSDALQATTQAASTSPGARSASASSSSSSSTSGSSGFARSTSRSASPTTLTSTSGASSPSVGPVGSASSSPPVPGPTALAAHGTPVGTDVQTRQAGAGPLAGSTEDHATPGLLRRALAGGAGLLDRRLRDTNRRAVLGAPVSAGAEPLQRGATAASPPRRALEAVTDRAASTGLTTLAATTPHRALGASARSSAHADTADAGNAPQQEPSAGERSSTAPHPAAASGHGAAPRPLAARSSRPVGTIARGPSIIDLAHLAQPPGTGQAAGGTAPQAGRPTPARFTPAPAGHPATIRRMPLTHTRPASGRETVRPVAATGHLAARRGAGVVYRLGATPALPRGLGVPLGAARAKAAPASTAATSTAPRRPLTDVVASRPVTATAASRSAAVASPMVLTAAPRSTVTSRSSHTGSTAPSATATATAGSPTVRRSPAGTRSTHDASSVSAERGRALVGAAVGPLPRSLDAGSPRAGSAHDARRTAQDDPRRAGRGTTARAAVAAAASSSPSAAGAAHLEGALHPIARTTLRRWAGSAAAPVRSASADTGASVGTLTRVAGATGRGTRSAGGAGPGRGAREGSSLSAFRPGRSVVPSRGGARASGGTAPTWQVESTPHAARDGSSPAVPVLPRPTRPGGRTAAGPGTTGRTAAGRDAVGRDAAGRRAAGQPTPGRGTANAAPAILRWASVRPAPRVVSSAPSPGSHRSGAAGPGPRGRTPHGTPPPVPDDTAAQLSVLRSITGRHLTGPQGSIPDEGRTMSDGPRIGQHRAGAAGGALGVGPGGGDSSLGDMEQRVLESLDRRITARLDGELAQIIEDRVVRRVEDRLLEALDRTGSGSMGVF